MTLPRAGRGGGLWKTREQEELPGILQEFCRGEHSEGQGIEMHAAGWCWGPGYAPKGCVLYSLCCAPRTICYIFDAVQRALCPVQCVPYIPCAVHRVFRALHFVLLSVRGVLHPLCCAACAVR